MKKILYSMLILASCNENKKAETSSREEIDKDIAADKKIYMPSTGCYQMIISRDTATMDLSVTGNTVTGKLNYKAYEKDSNSGNFTGTIDSNKLVAWYTFQSEGVISVRQVVFKIQENSFTEGYGDFEVTGDTAFFKYPHTLSFEESHPFTKIACK